jgi:phage tail tube protein FII
MYAASGSLAPVEIDVSGVADLRDYANVQSYLESLNFATHVSVESLSGDTVRFRLTTRGGIESLQHAIALNGRLQSVPMGDDGIPRFQLRR